MKKEFVEKFIKENNETIKKMNKEKENTSQKITIEKITKWLKKNGYGYNIWTPDKKILTDSTNNPSSRLEIHSSGNVGI